MQVFHAKCPSCICCVFQTAPGSVVVRTTNSLGRKDCELELNLPEHFWLCDLSNHFLNPAGTAHDDLNVHSLFVSSCFYLLLLCLLAFFHALFSLIAFTSDLIFLVFLKLWGHIWSSRSVGTVTNLLNTTWQWQPISESNILFMS